MRKLNISFLLRLSEKEYERLQKHVLKTGLSREALIRALLSGYQPKELPPLDYHTMIQELHAIGINLNQIAARVNATGGIDKAVFQYEANRLRRAVLNIQAAFTLPEKRFDDGAEIAHAIGVRLARELWGNWFEVVVSTHLDKNICILIL